MDRTHVGNRFAKFRIQPPTPKEESMKKSLRRITTLFSIAMIAVLVLTACTITVAPTAPMAEMEATAEPTVMAEAMPTAEPTAEPTAMAEETAEEEMPAEEEMADMEESDTVDVAGLRVTLDQLLGEHVLLAASATGAALGGRQAEFEAAAGALDTNSQDLATAIGSIYGDAAGEAFLPLWRTHIGFFVDYTVATATDDAAMKQKAIDDLTGYASDFGAFLNSANPDLPIQAVVDLLVPHVGTLTAVIDAQAAGDNEAAFAALRESYMHMDMIASALAGSIGAQFPEVFSGSVDSASAGLYSALNTLLAEHVYLAAMATNAALDGRQTEFEAAAGALDGNSMDLAGAVGSVYGDAAGEAFLPLWRTHIGFFVDYTVATATGDEAMKQKAIDDLTGYATDFGAFLNSANPDLPVEAVVGLLVPHVGTLTAVIDAQAADMPVEAYTALREAYGHMRMVADALAGSIVAQFPETFGMAMMDEEMDHSSMDMADEAVMPAAMLRGVLQQLLGEHVLLASSATEAALRGRQAEFEAAAGARWMATARISQVQLAWSMATPLAKPSLNSGAPTSASLSITQWRLPVVMMTAKPKRWPI